MTSKKNMDKNLTTTWNREDRDLLVELRTEMRGVRADFKEMTDGTAKRLDALEREKLDRTEANRLQSETLAVQGDHALRIRTLEDGSGIHRTQVKTLLAVAAVVWAIFQVGLQLALNLLRN